MGNCIDSISGRKSGAAVLQQELNYSQVPNPFMISSTDHLIIQRSDMVYKSFKDFTRLYSMKARILDVEPNCDGFKITRLGCDDIKRVLICHSNPPHQSYHSIRRVIDHPYISKAFEYYEEKEKVYIVSEHFEGDNFYDYISAKKSLNEDEAAIITRQLLLAINFLHQNFICCRGLQPENILIRGTDEITTKITGLTNATFCAATTFLAEQMEITNFTAPEIIEGNYNLKCDVWAVGALLYFMLSGLTPFEGNEGTLPQRIHEAKVDLDASEWDLVSPQAKFFLLRLLGRNPDTRLSAQEALRDPWIMKYAPKVPQIVLDEIFKNLAKFKPKNKLQEMLWFFITDTVLSDKDFEELPAIFDYLDLSNNGRISREDLCKKFDERAVDSIMENADINKSGYLEYSEFIMAALSRERIITEEIIKAAFVMLDNNRDGFITFNDLKTTFRYSEQGLIKEKVWEELLSQGDDDEDGKLSCEDVIRFMSDMQ